MQLTEQQVTRIMSRAMVTQGMCDEKQAERECADATDKERRDAHRSVEAVISAAIELGLVVAPGASGESKRFVDLRQLPNV